MICFVFVVYRQEARDVRVIQCHIFNTSSGTTGAAVLTSSYRIFMVTNIDEPRIRRLAEVPGYVEAICTEDAVNRLGAAGDDDDDDKVTLKKNCLRKNVLL